MLSGHKGRKHEMAKTKAGSSNPRAMGNSSAWQRGAKGFSLVEAIVVVAVGMIILGFTIPSVQSALRNYTLNSAATNVTRMFSTARYVAINQGSNACTVLQNRQYGVDTNCNGTLDNTETRMAVPNGVSLASSGPALTGLPFPTTPAIVSCANFAITFNNRGTKTTVCGTATGGAVTNIIFIAGWGNTRAVTITGIGRARTWTYTGTTWR